VDVHSGAVIATGSLEAEIARPQPRYPAQTTVLDRLVYPLKQAAHERKPIRLQPSLVVVPADLDARARTAADLLGPPLLGLADDARHERGQVTLADVLLDLDPDHLSWAHALIQELDHSAQFGRDEVGDEHQPDTP
jgi:hypothetical protein